MNTSRILAAFSAATRLGAHRVFAPTRPLSVYPVQSLPAELANVSSSWAELHEFSLRNPDDFFGSLALSRLRWKKPFTKVREVDYHLGSIAWFLGGQLNVSENCLDRHVETDPERVALVWEKDEPGQSENVTYRELLDMTCRVGNVLREHGVCRGDRVGIYLPVFPLAVATMLACARIGAVHSVVFAGFGAESLKTRILDAQAKVIVTADQALRAGKAINLKEVVDVAVADCPCVKHVFVAQRTGEKVPMQAGRDVILDDAMKSVGGSCKAEAMNSEDPLYLLYTSGSTGKPKGIKHTQAGYLLYAGLSHQYVFDSWPGDVYACVADIGWVAGHTNIVYGPLANGVTSVLFESGVPIYPDPGRYWEMVQRLGIKQLYTAPTAIRMLMKYSDDYVTKYNRSSLRTLGTVGEPINAKAWQWYYDVPGGGRCTVVDTWWQTETGGVCLSPRPGPDTELKPGMPMRPFWGVDPVLVDPNTGKVLEGNSVTGHLCLRQVPPSMARTINGDHERYLETYWRKHPGLYFSGDEARRDSDGHYELMGRVDDVLNPKGHRLDTAEVEGVLVKCEDVVEAAVVGYPHAEFGDGVYAFVCKSHEATSSDEETEQELKALVRKHIGGFAVPNRILIVRGLPKVRAGKIMRRILRSIAVNKSSELGDTSTLAEPAVVDDIIDQHQKKYPK